MPAVLIGTLDQIIDDVRARRDRLDLSYFIFADRDPEVPAEDAGLASGMVNVSMQLSGALGLAVLGSLSSDRTAALMTQGVALNPSLIGGFHLSFTVAAVCVGIGLLVAQLWLRPTPRRPPESGNLVVIEPTSSRSSNAA
jgi:hypothetical protein